MKRIYLIVFSLLSSYSSLKAQLPTFDWAKQLNSDYADYADLITTDERSNVFVVGRNDSSIYYSYNKISISKIDANGNTVWSKSLNRAFGLEYKGIIYDGNSNLYLIGNFHHTVDFDPGPNIQNLTALSIDIFIQKIDTNGNLMWVKQLKGGGLAIDLIKGPNNTINIYGSYSGSLDFDPGPGTYYDTSFQSSTQVFVMNMDALGNFQWVKFFHGHSNAPQGIIHGTAITTDNNNNIYLTGDYAHDVDFDPGQGIQTITTSMTSAFVLKLDYHGNYIWVKGFNGNNTCYGKDLTTDKEGNIYIIGSFNGTIDFDPGSAVQNLTALGFFDVFIQKMDSMGNFLWVKQTASGNNSITYYERLTSDHLGNLYSTTTFSGTMDIDPSNAVQNLTSSATDAFLQKLDTNGNLLWVYQLGGNGDDQISSTCIDTALNIWTVGYFEQTADFDPGANVFNMTSMGNYDGFIQKLDTKTAIQTIGNIPLPTFTIYPNPTSKDLFIVFTNPQNKISIILKNVFGQSIRQFQFNNTSHVQIEINEPNGIYFLEVENEQKQKTITKVILN